MCVERRERVGRGGVCGRRTMVDIMMMIHYMEEENVREDTETIKTIVLTP